MTPTVSCVVVAFHRPNSLTALLGGLHHPEVETIVVNVENDRAVSEVAGVLALPLEGNPGYAAAVNAGARAAGAPVVVFMNDDVRVDARTALALAATVSGGEADVVVPRVLDGEGRQELTIAALPRPASLFWEWFLLPDKPLRLFRSRTRPVQKWRLPARPELVDAATGAVVATSASWLLREPLPEEYFLYWEESAWFWRLHAAGARVLYDPRAVVTHTGGRDDVRAAKSRLMARNAVRCVRRTQGRRAAAAAWAVVLLWNLRLVVLDGARHLVGSPAVDGRLRARSAGLLAAVMAWREV